MTLEEAVNIAARNLPDGWQITLTIEKGAGWVDLFDADGDGVLFTTSPDSDLAQQIDDAINYARSCEQLAPVPSPKE